MKSLLLRLCLCLTALGAVSSCNSTPLELPAPVMYSEPGPNMRDVIVKAMTSRNNGWRMVDEDDGRIRARLTNRSHVAVVDIFYDGTEVTFAHVSSENLKEEVGDDGQVTIHKRYNQWLGNLRNDIENQLLLAKMEQ